MKKTWTLSLALFIALFGFSQTDTTGKKIGKEKVDTIRIGNITIINKDGKEEEDSTTNKEKIDTIKVGGIIIINKNGKDNNTSVKISSRKKEYKPSNLRTNWWIVDLGFANYNDQTNYASAAAQQFAPGDNEDWFKLKTGKSVNVNLWIFMQRLSLIKHVVNLKYGLGVEMNNYRYQTAIVYQTNPTKVVMDNSTNYTKNKLAAHYLTVPMMLNFNFNPEKKNGFGFSVGASAGYLYSSRQKTITSTNGKNKVNDDFDLRPFKFSYIGELHLGPVKLYGSLASKSMFEKGLDQKPYSIGIRFSNW